MSQHWKIIDISQPVSSTTACFPGDTPFSRKITLDVADNQVVNLTSYAMSPHVGTHADAPLHLAGNMTEASCPVGSLPLNPFIGDAYVADLAPFNGEITEEAVSAKLGNLEPLPPRILFRTAERINYDRFEESYSYFSPGLVKNLAARGVELMGIDTPSVDHVDSKKLETHKALIAAKMSWLENLDLTQVLQGKYILVALPLKFMELEASPVRAVLLSS